MTDRLSIYNGACQVIGERRLVSLTENRRARRELDSVWERSGVRTCLEAAQWMFAVRTAVLDYSASIEPTFGYQRAFEKGTDWVRTCAVCSDEFFNAPLTAYADENSILYASLDQIYVKFVSEDANYGGDLSRWPQNFCRYVEHHFARQVAKPVAQATLTELADIDKKLKHWFDVAAASDAMNQPPAFQPTGSWVRARRRGSSVNNDMGSISRLIG